MRGRAALISASALLLVAARPAAPPVLAPYIKDGRFEPGDYGWMRGRFADANAVEKAQFRSIDKWLLACGTEAAAEMKRDLVQAGIPDPKLTPQPLQDRVCGAVGLAIPYDGIQLDSFERFQQDMGTAQPIASAFLFATAAAETVGGPHGPTLGDRLSARTLGEQMLQFGMSWGDGQVKGAPPLDPGVRAIVIRLLWLALDDRTRANTTWLKQIVEKDGWPRQSKVGEHAAYQAWLLAQHSDHDPLFQLQALRLMEPLVAAGEVSKQNYAYLYDRVMLKLTGKQRYATQMTCVGEKYVPQPIEDETAVAKRRAEVGLNSLAEYIAMMQATLGGCGSK